MRKINRLRFVSALCVLLAMVLGLLGLFKEEPVFDVALPSGPPAVQLDMADGELSWDQTGDSYFLRIENTGRDSVDAHVKYGLPWPGYILTINPGDTWELAVENSHHRTHTITFECEESTPIGRVEVWTSQ